MLKTQRQGLGMKNEQRNRRRGTRPPPLPRVRSGSHTQALRTLPRPERDPVLPLFSLNGLRPEGLILLHPTKHTWLRGARRALPTKATPCLPSGLHRLSQPCSWTLKAELPTSFTWGQAGPCSGARGERLRAGSRRGFPKGATWPAASASWGLFKRESWSMRG